MPCPSPSSRSPVPCTSSRGCPACASASRPGTGSGTPPGSCPGSKRSSSAWGASDGFAALGVEVTGLGRDGRSYDVPGLCRVIGRADLERTLPQIGILVLCCPLTPRTTGLIGGEQLALLPPHAVLVNIARGPVVDQDALIAALAAGRLTGACLDVFTPEPLAASSPLWGMDNVLISPHSASTVAAENARLTDLFIDNLGRFSAGRPLRNRYEPERGY